MSNFPACLAETLKHEGGWSDHPSDPGGATMKGVTLATFRRHFGAARTPAELRAITDAQLQHIYRTGYWAPVRGDDLPRGVDLAVFDFGVNSGPTRAVRTLQSSVGTPVDGKFGPLTLLAVNGAEPAGVVSDVCERRLQFLTGLSNWKVFGRGWGRRVGSIKATALVWAGATVTDLRNEADADDEAAARDARGGTASAGGGAASGGAAAVGEPAAAFDWLAVGVLGAIALLAIVIAVVLYRRAAARREVARAVRAAAQSSDMPGGQ